MSDTSDDREIRALADSLVSAARSNHVKLAVAESCTGGRVSAAITAIAGSSDVFECGFVTYSNSSKAALLNVPPHLIDEHGAVSEAVARAMAEGAITRSRARVGVAITGIAGPGGGSPTKPVGLVHFATALSGHPTTALEMRYGSLMREDIRSAAVRTALHLLLDGVRRL